MQHTSVKLFVAADGLWYRSMCHFDPPGRRSGQGPNADEAASEPRRSPRIGRRGTTSDPTPPNPNSSRAAPAARGLESSKGGGGGGRAADGTASCGGWPPSILFFCAHPVAPGAVSVNPAAKRAVGGGGRGVGAGGAPRRGAHAPPRSLRSPRRAGPRARRAQHAHYIS